MLISAIPNLKPLNMYIDTQDLVTSLYLATDISPGMRRMRKRHGLYRASCALWTRTSADDCQSKDDLVFRVEVMKVPPSMVVVQDSLEESSHTAIMMSGEGLALSMIQVSAMLKVRRENDPMLGIE